MEEVLLVWFIMLVSLGVKPRSEGVVGSDFVKEIPLCLPCKTRRVDKPHSNESRVGFRELLKGASLSTLHPFPPSLLQIINENFVITVMLFKVPEK